MTESVSEIYKRYSRNGGLLEKFQQEYKVYNGILQSDYNASAHAYVSAAIALHHGEFLASLFGEGRELRTFLFDKNSSLEDGRRDIFNNRVGIEIAKFAIANKLTEEDLGPLVADALTRGLLVVNEFKDKRVNIPGKNLFIAGVIYDGPSGKLSTSLEGKYGFAPGTIKRGTAAGEGVREYFPQFPDNPPMPIPRPTTIPDGKSTNEDIKEGRTESPRLTKVTRAQFIDRNALVGPDTDLLPDGVRRKLEAQSWLVEPVSAGSIGTAKSGDETVIAQNDMADGTNNEQELVAVPVPRPRPQLTPVKQGVLKGMPDDERLVLAAEFMALTGRKETDAAEAAMIERMEVQRKMAQDLADLKAGKLSTVWKETGYPKPVRDVLGEEAFQSFVDDRLEVASIAHASSGLHLLQDADLAGIADGTSPVTPADKNAAALITPKVQAAVAKSARTVLDLRQRTPAEAVLLSGQLGKRKAQFDASFDSGAAVDGDEMAAFLFYLETAQHEIGTADANIEPIPQSWAKQVAARFATPLAGGAAAPNRRSREAEIKQHYTELQQSFGPRTDDVIAYSLGRFGGNQATPSGDNRAG